jgi:hypothetical protein
MASPTTQTVAVRFSQSEYTLISALARVHQLTTSDVVRELIGFGREEEAHRAQLRVVSA